MDRGTHRRRMGPLYLVLAVTTLGALRGVAADSAASSGLQAGFARADITPNPGMLNWTRTPPRPYGEVHDPLFARALVLADSSTRVVFIGWDLLDAREHAVRRIREAVSKATGIPADHVMIQATHNHSGPKSEMGSDPVLKQEQASSRAVQDGPFYREWSDRLAATCVDLVRQADGARQAATLGLARAWVGDWLFNRRPVLPDGRVQTMMVPADPYVLGQGLRFGMVDPTMTVVSLRGPDGENICTLFHLPMHAVAVYGAYAGVSADWPGRVTELIQEPLGGGAMFLQGCAGDIVPARRRFEAVEAMAPVIAARVLAANKVALKLDPGAIRVSRAMADLPATPAAAADIGRQTIDAEVALVRVGPLAFVMLPGEPLQEISTAIQQRSPFAHTLVLGYANGRGAGYIGLPGGKARGGYEMTRVGAAMDDAGGILVETAVRLLREAAVGEKPAGAAP